MTKYLLILLLCFKMKAYQQTYNLSFTLTCDKINVGACASWIINGTLQQDTSGCFPGDTLLLTDTGYKTMEELKVGDHVYAYNAQNHRNEFTRVEAWLHRDISSYYQYVEIGNKETNAIVYASQFHSIATLTEHNSIGYEFSGDMLNKRLIDSEGRSYHVNKTGRKVLRGIYAPYTTLGNYYIVNPQSPALHFLVHCFAHLKNPQNYELIFGWSITIAGWFGLNEQPVGSSYRHPLSIFYQSMFPELIEKDGYYVGYESFNNIGKADSLAYSHSMTGSSTVASTTASSNGQRRRRLIKLMSTATALITQNPLFTG